MAQIHWAAGDGNFNTATDWQPNGIPGAGDDVGIDAAGACTVTATTDETIALLTVGANATLAVSAGTFTVYLGFPGWVTSVLVWGNLVIDSGAVLAPVSALLNGTDGTIAGAGQLGAGQLQLYNFGTVNANGIEPLRIVSSDGAYLYNFSSGLIEATGAGGLTLTSGTSGTIGNSGTMLATGAGGLTIANGKVDNSGIMQAANGSTLTLQSGVVNLDNTDGVLSWGTFQWNGGVGVGAGTWEADSGSTLAVTGGAVTVDKAGIILSGPGSVFRAGDGSTFTNLEASLLNVAPIGVLELLAGRSFTATHGISDFGMIQLAGGALTLPKLAVGAGGHVRGFGTISDTRLGLWNGGTIEANGGTLAITTAIDPASTGVFQIDASSLLKVAADQGASGKMKFLGAGGELVIDNAQKFGLNVGTSAYTGPLIENFATGDMILLKNVAPAGLTPVYDASTGILQITKGSANFASLIFDKTTLGTGSFHVRNDGLGHTLVTHS